MASETGAICATCGTERLPGALATLLAPTEGEMAESVEAIEGARETLTRLGAVWLIARLGTAPSMPSAAQPTAAPVAGA